MLKLKSAIIIFIDFVLPFIMALILVVGMIIALLMTPYLIMTIICVDKMTTLLIEIIWVVLVIGYIILRNIRWKYS